MQKSPDSGAYQILFKIESPQKIQIGKKGRFLFPAGFYIYTGSAMKNLQSRIKRHYSKNKKMHWHIDYLLKHAEILCIKVFPSLKREECKINRKTQKLSGAQNIVPGFGSSDCTQCPSHLTYFKNPPL